MCVSDIKKSPRKPLRYEPVSVYKEARECKKCLEPICDRVEGARRGEETRNPPNTSLIDFLRKKAARFVFFYRAHCSWSEGYVRRVDEQTKVFVRRTFADLLRTPAVEFFWWSAFRGP